MLGTQAYSQSASDATGTWLTEDGRAKIRIEHCGEANKRICGFVVWMKDPLTEEGQPRLDINNPDPAKRHRPSLGMELMSGLKPDDDQHYAGEIYNADNGKMYSITLSVESQDELKVHGCMLKFLCGSQSWSRVADLPVPGTKVVATTPVTKTTKPAGTGSAHLHDSQPPAQ